ncbi:hypothetical protein CFIMG_004892RA [Ceratocystis fimbriata CBS 114723]|uniref:Uncharacterized protein n=1 Tax=Ceratocystis fimbriata CBS 114723 TaxID=1035309 RepID=A0A2C5WUB0_9PEZI|nr:hypothetical protein CFIMG_004892RA [Ceratocystis fimbriata CBS 114723]
MLQLLLPLANNSASQSRQPPRLFLPALSLSTALVGLSATPSPNPIKIHHQHRCRYFFSVGYRQVVSWACCIIHERKGFASWQA